MFRYATTRSGLALAVAAAALLLAPQAASARAHHRHHAMRGPAAKTARLIPAVAKPGYRSMVGRPTLIDPVPVAAGGGVLGLGVIPSTGTFKGVPVLGELGL